MNIFKIIIIFALIYLKKLSEYKIAESYALLKSMGTCYRAIAELNGYIKGKKQKIIKHELKNLLVLEIKHSMAFESNAIAPLRLFELLHTEKKQNDKTIENIQLCLTHFELMPLLSVQSILPFLLLEYSEKQRGENAALYAQFKRQFNTYLEENNYEEPLLQGILLATYLFYFKPLKVANNYAAIYILNAKMGESAALELPLINIAYYLKEDYKHFYTLLKDGYEGHNLQPLALYLLATISKACSIKLKQLIAIDELKKTTLEQLRKYHQLTLPSAELLNILFASPYIKAKNLIIQLPCHRQTAYSYLTHLQDMGILIEKKIGREKLYLHKRYMDLLLT